MNFKEVKKRGLYIFAVIGVISILLFSGYFVSSNLKQKSVSSYDRYGETSASSAGPGSLKTDESYANKSQKQASKDSSETENADDLTQRKIIKNGSLSLLVEKAEETVSVIESIAKDMGGFVSESNIYETSEETKSGDIVIRVPSDNFSEAMAKIKDLAIKVEQENTTNKDVTEQSIDLEAQLKNLRSEESQYLNIMKKAKTIEEILNVSQRLSSVRARIDRIEGQLKYLSGQVEMSSISVILTSEADIEVFGIRWRPLFVIKQSLSQALKGLRSYVYAIIKLIFQAPLIIIWITTLYVLFALAYRFFKFLHKKIFSKRSVSRKK